MIQATVKKDSTRETKKNTENFIRISLSPLERENLIANLSSTVSPFENSEVFLIQAKKGVLNSLSLSTIQKINYFSNHPQSPGLVYLTDLPQEINLPATPKDGSSPFKKNYFSEAMSAGFSSLLGEVLGFESEKKGSLIHNVVPMQCGAQTQSNREVLSF